MLPTEPLAGKLDVALDAVPGSVGAARRAVCAVAAAHGAGHSELERVALAVSEAVTNAVEHAYRPRGDAHRCEINVVASISGSELSVLVSDDGAGLEAAPERPGLGLGMGIIAYCCDSLTIGRRSGGGTLLEMSFTLSEDREPHVREELLVQLRGSVASAIAPA